MNKILISIFSGALLLGAAAAQDSTTPAPPSSDPQTAAPAQVPQQAAPTAPAEQSQAPQPAASQGAANAPKRIAAGSVIPVSLTKTLDAKKAKSGDEVVAKVSQDLKTNTGEVLVPKDTKIVGHVTGAQARSKEQKESEIGIAFDRAVMKDGGDMQMPMSIQAIIGQQNNTPQSNANAGGAGYGSGSGTGTNTTSSTGRSGGMGGGSTPTPPEPSMGGGSMPSEGQ
jgi:hypothetical protein